MSCVVGYRTKDYVIIGADSCAISGYVNRSRKDLKIFQNGPCLIGCVGSFRMMNLLHYSLAIPERKKMDVDRWMNTVFIDVVRECLKDGGYAKKENNVECGGQFMAAVWNRLFIVESDFQIAEYRKPYAAMGSGEEFAMGALYAMEKANEHPYDQVGVALAAAAQFTQSVGRPFHIKTMEWGLEKS